MLLRHTLLHEKLYHRWRLCLLHFECVECTQLPGAQAREGVKGRFWFMEADMRQTQTLRPDKTGKALLTVLRHLGRLHEVRPSRHSACILICAVSAFSIQ